MSHSNYNTFCDLCSGPLIANRDECTRCIGLAWHFLLV